MTESRDVRIDIIRGIALICILIDHIPGNVLAGLTLQNFAFSDAAEVLVFLAGMSAAAGALARCGSKGDLATHFAWSIRRAKRLYVMHLGLVVSCTSIMLVAAHVLNNNALLARAHVDNVDIRYLVDIVTLTLQPDYLNILPLYVVFVAALSPTFLLLRAHTILGLTASIALWWISGSVPLVRADGWYFNPFAWQLLFVIGMVAQLKRGPLTEVARLPWVQCVAFGFIALSLVAKAPWAQLPWFATWQFDVPAPLLQSSKTFLALPRLANTIALAVLAVSLTELAEARLHGPSAQCLRLVGQHALAVYVTATLFGTLATIARLAGARGVQYQIFSNALGLILIVSVALGAEHRRRRKRERCRVEPKSHLTRSIHLNQSAGSVQPSCSAFQALSDRFGGDTSCRPGISRLPDVSSG